MHNRCAGERRSRTGKDSRIQGAFVSLSLVAAGGRSVRHLGRLDARECAPISSAGESASTEAEPLALMTGNSSAAPAVSASNWSSFPPAPRRLDAGICPHRFAGLKINPYS
jgi:hypothetical protein